MHHHQGTLLILTQKAEEDNEEPTAHQDRKETKGILETLEEAERQGPEDRRAHQDHQDPQDRKDRKAHEDREDRKALWDHQDLPEDPPAL